METKAAKTLAIIVGCFILCWCPFFTMYLIRPFCNDCIDPLLFSILFWLGYCNSAVNPMIYALFSKDFRFAFKRIICKCFCSGPAFGRDTSRRGSDMSHFKTGGRTPSISPSAQAHSLDENSDPVLENSDSRWRSFAMSVTSTTSSTILGGGQQHPHRASSSGSRGPVYDICHPLVMESPSYVYCSSTLNNNNQKGSINMGRLDSGSGTIMISSIGTAKLNCDNDKLMQGASIWSFWTYKWLNMCFLSNNLST